MVTMHLLNINIVEKNKENIVDSSIRVGNIEGMTQYELSLASTVNLWQQLDRSFGSFFFFSLRRDGGSFFLLEIVPLSPTAREKRSYANRQTHYATNM